MDIKQCKFSQQSLEELRLCNECGICPGCKRHKTLHSMVVGLNKIQFTRKNFWPRTKRFCCKVSVQTIVITTIAAFVIFALGVSVNYLLKDHDKAEHLTMDQIDGNEMAENNVGHRSEISAPARAIPITVASSTSLSYKNHNRKIIGLVLVGTLFTGFYVMIIVCLKRRQIRLHEQALLACNKALENDLQNISTDIQGSKNGWMKLPKTMV